VRTVLFSWTMNWFLVVYSTNACTLEMVVVVGSPRYMPKIPTAPNRKPTVGL